MKVECVKDQVLEAISVVERVSTKNATLPILSGIFLQARNNSLLARATNLEFGIEVEIPAKVFTEGSFVIPGSVLLNTILNSYGSSTILFEEKEKNLTVKTSTGKTVIKSLPPEDFPWRCRIHLFLIF